MCTGLRQTGCYAGQHRASGRLRIDWIAFANPAASGPVWAIDLDNLVALAGEETSQPGTERTGAFHAKGHYDSKACGPLLEVLVPCESDSTTVFTQVGAEAVDGNGNVLILVSIDSHHYPGGIEMYDFDHSCLLVH